MSDIPGLVSVPGQPRLGAASEPARPGDAPPVDRGRRRRRPSGEPPPLPRPLARSGRYWIALLAGVAVFLIPFGARQTGHSIDLFDSRVIDAIAGIRASWLTTTAHGVSDIATTWPIRVGWWLTFASLAVFRRWHHLVVWFLSVMVVDATATLVADAVHRPRPVGVEILGSWQGLSMPSRPVAVLAATLVGILYTLLPQGRLREAGKYATTVIVGGVALSRVYLGVDHPTDVVIGVVLGVAIPLVAFRSLTPNEVFPVTYRRGRTAHVSIEGARGVAIRRALQEQLGLIVVDVKPFALEGSGGSTPLRVTLDGDPPTYVFCKLYTATHLRSDRSYKIVRTLLYGRLEDETAFGTVRRLVQYEDYALRVLKAADLPVPQPYGVVEITPEREYLVVMEFFDNAREVDASGPPSDDIIDQGMTIVRRLWDAGLAHRDIKPANLLVRDGTLLLIDSAFTEVRPTPWRQAVDLANMMLVLSLGADVERVYQRARMVFTVDEIAEALAATRGLAMPSQLRRLIRQHGRDLHAALVAQLPYRPRPIVIQRWSIRRVLLWIAVLVAAFFTLQVGSVLLSGPL